MFIAIDEDDIGLKLERFIILCQHESLFQYWKIVSNIISNLEKRLISLGAKILLCGGDSIVAELD